MTDEPRSASGAWRTYLELAGGLGEASRKQVRKVVKELVGKGNATAEQLRTLTTELVAANAANREALGKLVKVEVDRALGRVGLATMDEVNELTSRVRDLERQLRDARSVASALATGPTVAPTPPAGRVAATAEPVAPARATRARKTAAPAKAAAVKTAPAKATTTTKATTTKAIATKAAGVKAIPAKATKARRTSQ